MGFTGNKKHLFFFQLLFSTGVGRHNEQTLALICGRHVSYQTLHVSYMTRRKWQNVKFTTRINGGFLQKELRAEERKCNRIQRSRRGAVGGRGVVENLDLQRVIPFH